MNIPSTERCMELLKEYKVPENIIEHSLKVNGAAMFIGKKLKENGVDINLEILNAASLLHDIDKIFTLKDPKMHGELSCELLADKGYPEVGEVIKAHKAEYLKTGLIDTWEKKVLNYADCKVQFDKVVPLKARFEYGRKRYPHFAKPENLIVEDIAHKLEKEICDKAGIKHEDIK